MSKVKKLPEFASEVEERKFWESHGSSEYVDWSRAKKVVMPNLKSSTKTISLRLSEMLLESIKVEEQAGYALPVPYQSLARKDVKHSREAS